MMEIANRILIKFVHSIYIILQSVFLQCKFRICKGCFHCQMVQIDCNTWIIEDNRGITFLTTDNKNRIFTSVDNDGIGCEFVSPVIPTVEDSECEKNF